MFTARFQAWVRRNAERIAGRVAGLGVTPNQLTVTGVALALVAALLAAGGMLVPAGLVLAAGGVFDIFDGAVARATGSGTRFGAFFDSTLDRLSEAAVFAGIAFYFAGRPGGRWGVLAALGALAGSFFVSYAKARAEGLDLEVHSGLFARPERVVATVAGLLLGPVVLLWVLAGLALLTNFTALQRVIEVWRKTREPRPEGTRERRLAAGRKAAVWRP